MANSEDFCRGRAYPTQGDASLAPTENLEYCSHLAQGASGETTGRAASCSGTQVLVIGYGNPLRRDDGLGQRAAYQLSDVLTTEYPVEVMFTHQLTYDLAESVSRVQHVILIDAAVGDTPGAITCREVLPQGDQPHTLLHHMEAGALLASTLVLYGTAPHTTLWTVVGESFEFGEALSPAVEQALPELMAQIAAYIQALCCPQAE